MRPATRTARAAGHGGAIVARRLHQELRAAVEALKGLQSALNPHSPQAEAIADLAWLLVGGAAVLFVLVMALAAIAVVRRPAWLSGTRSIVAGGIVLPVAVLAALLVHSVARLGHAAGTDAPAVRIEVVGHQFWWRVRYLGADDAVAFETANELRVPVGQTVEVTLASDDVLHSFWVPALAGKLDAIPGRTNRLRFAAARAGTWRGQCAEYCGVAHAHMALHVVALAPDTYEAWAARQREPARAALPPLFAELCATCHAVRGTAAAGTLGPDLTHVGSRIAIAAATLPNDPDALATWIASAQHVKPGNLMPQFGALDPAQVRDLAAWLHGLE
jgi:cytochrome c oxidase subunit 2